MKKGAFILPLLGLIGLAMGCKQPMMGNKMSANHPAPAVADFASPQRT